MSNDQAWININNETGSLYIDGKPFHIKTDNGTHILTKIENLHGSSEFNTMNYDKTTGLTTYVPKPGSFSIGNVTLNNVQYFMQTLPNGTGVLYIY